MNYETFLNYRGYRWLSIALFVTALLTIGYLIAPKPFDGYNGGSPFGIFVGIISTAAIAYLMWFGVRKRSYYSSKGSLQGWLSAHVWLGIALSYIVLLHSGFSFHCNLHTAAYLCMLLTIVSGIAGAYVYRRLPVEIQSNRGKASVKVLTQEFQKLGYELDRLSQRSSLKVQEFVTKTNEAQVPSLLRILVLSNHTLEKLGLLKLDEEKATILLDNLPDEEHPEAKEALRIIHAKYNLIPQICSEVRVLSWLRVWLYLHIPLSVMCLVGVALHIGVVLFYW